MGGSNKINVQQYLRMLHPSLLSLQLLFSNWSLFLWTEKFNLLLLFSIVYLLQQYLLFHKLRLWLYWLCITLYRKWMAGGMCRSDVRLNGYTIIITGADEGVGKEVAVDLAVRGAHLVLASPDLEKAEQTKRDLVELKGSVEIRQCDMSSLESVREFANGIINHKYHIHMLVNVAHESMCPQKVTTDGIEQQMAVNHTGHFLLTNMLLPWLTHHRPARIINITSSTHNGGQIPFGDFDYKQSGYSSWKAFCNSSLATVLFSKQLAKKVQGTNVEVFCATLGLFQSSLYRHYIPEVVPQILLDFFLQTPKEGAQTVVHCATEAESEEGFYFSDCCPTRPSDEAMDDELGQRFWRESQKLTGLT